MILIIFSFFLSVLGFFSFVFFLLDRMLSSSPWNRCVLFFISSSLNSFIITRKILSGRSFSVTMLRIFKGLSLISLLTCFPVFLLRFYLVGLVKLCPCSLNRCRVTFFIYNQYIRVFQSFGIYFLFSNYHFTAEGISILLAFSVNLAISVVISFWISWSFL